MTEEHLATGWEPTVPEGDTLLRAALLATADRMRHQVRSLDGRIEEGDGYVLADSGVPNFFLNGAMALRPECIDKAVDAALAFYDGPFAVFSAWPTPDLRSRGLTLAGHPPLMMRPAGGDAPPLPPGLEIRRVADEAGIEDYRKVLEEGFPMPGMSRFLGTSGLTSQAPHWIGYEDGRPVSVAAAFIGTDVVDVEWVATLPDARGRGYGAAVTWKATLADPSRPAVLIASDDGRPVYTRMGYLPIMRWTLWFRG